MQPVYVNLFLIAIFVALSDALPTTANADSVNNIPLFTWQTILGLSVTVGAESILLLYLFIAHGDVRIRQWLHYIREFFEKFCGCCVGKRGKA